jgi:polysaccharide export outer membrane protein
MNFVSKLTLFSCAALLAGTLLSGCRSTSEPVLSDNPTPPPAMSGTGNSNGNPTGTEAEGGTGMSTGPATSPESFTGSSNDLGSSLPPLTARFQQGETVNISTSTGSEMVPGPIPTAQPYLIADDGTISLPLVGNVQAAGKTPGELQEIITKLYVPQYFVRLAVTVTAINRVYYVGGEVTRPGPEEYLGQTTVSKAIQAAGDFTQFASHDVWLTRADGTRIRVNVDKALKDVDSDPQVFPGDQIHVPKRYF